MIGEIVMIVALSLVAALAWYPCCCGDSGLIECSYCSTDNAVMSVLVTPTPGNGTCDCSGVGGTFLIAQWTTACVWKNATPDGQVCTRNYNFSVTAKVIVPGSWGLEVLWKTDDVDYTIWRWSSGSASAFDCTEERVATFSSAYVSGYCAAMNGTSCTIN